MSNVDDDIIDDAEFTKDVLKFDEETYEVIAYHLPKDSPDELVVDENNLKFARHRLAKSASKERQWGNADLKRQGYVVIAIEMNSKTGQDVQVLARENTPRQIIDATRRSIIHNNVNERPAPKIRVIEEAQAILRKHMR